MEVAESTPVHEYVNPELDLMHQDCLEVLADAREDGIDRGYLNISTGCGKTRIAAKDVQAFLEQQPDARVLYLCHNTDILEGASNELRKILGPAISQGNIFGGSIEHESQVTMASFQQLNREVISGSGETKLYELIPRDHYDYVIVDESHHGPAETYRQVIEHLQPQFLLGLTATPDRRDQQDISEIFGQPLYQVLLEEAIAKGYVCPIDYRVFTEDMQRISESDTDTEGLTLKEITESIFVKRQDEEVVRIITEQLADVANPRMAVFCQTIADAERYAELLPGKVKAWHSKLHPDEQKARLEAFRKGELDTLTVIGKLDEGVDIPEANVAAFLRATESQTVFLQQLGRGLRRAEGKDAVIVLDFVANYNRIKFVTALQSRLKQTLHELRSQPTERQPFRFNFSNKVLDAINFVERARERIAKRAQPKEPQWQKIDKEIENLLGTALPKRARLSLRQERALLKRIKTGDRAAEQEYIIWRARTVYHIIKGYPEIRGFTQADYFQIGCEALLLEARQEAGSEGLKIKNSTADLHRKIEQAIGAEVAASNWPKVKDKEESTYRVGRRRVAPEAIVTLEQAKAEGIAPETPWESMVKVIDAETTAKVLGKLSIHETRVLQVRYGIGSQPLTYDVIGRSMYVTRERVRQIENQSLRKAAEFLETRGRQYTRVELESAVRKAIPIVISADPESRALAIRLGYMTFNPRILEGLRLKNARAKSEGGEGLDQREQAILSMADLHPRRPLGVLVMQSLTQRWKQEAEDPQLESSASEPVPESKADVASSKPLRLMSPEAKLQLQRLNFQRLKLATMLEQYPNDAPIIQGAIDKRLITEAHGAVSSRLKSLAAAYTLSD